MSLDLKKLAIGILGVSIAFVSDGIYCNNMIQTERIEIETSKNVSDIKIVQISDLHNKEFGRDSRKLVKIIRAENPDFVAITGDAVDFMRTDIWVVLSLCRQLITFTDIYYVSGNHEGGLNDSAKQLKFLELESGLREIGVVILDDKALELTDKGNVRIIGLYDTSFGTSRIDGIKSYSNEMELTSKKLELLLKVNDTEDNTFNILLSHKPELMDAYYNNHIDIAITGHAHGGQIRVPFIGGLFSPGQGIFPKYADGRYNYKGMDLIVSRGLGNSRFPLRIHNQVELVVINIHGSLSQKTV